MSVFELSNSGSGRREENEQEVDEEDGDKRNTTPDPEDVGLETGVSGAGVDEVRRSVADSEVEEPVGRGGKGHLLKKGKRVSTIWAEMKRDGNAPLHGWRWGRSHQ